MATHSTPLQRGRDLDLRLLHGVASLGITAGASAPEDHVQDCVEYLRAKFGAEVESRTVREEHVNFPLPRELRVLASA